MWNVADGVKAEYRISLGGRTSLPALSQDRRTLAVTAGGGTYLLEAATGKVLGRLEGEPGFAPAFDAAGTRLVDLSADAKRLRAWDLATGKLTHDVALPQDVAPGTRARTAAGDTAFLNTGDLVDLASGMVVWEYRTDDERPRWGPEVAGRHAVLVSSGEKAKRVHSLAFFALPHPAAVQRAAAMRPLANAPAAAQATMASIDAAGDRGRARRHP